MRHLTLLACAVLLFGCSKKNEGPVEPESLLPAVKSAFAERDRKLTSFEIQGTITQPAPTAQPDGGAVLTEAKFDVAHRAPNRLRGTLRGGDQELTYLFDGERLAQLDPRNKRMIEYDLNAPRDQVAFFIAQLSGTLVPEGYRVPVMDFGNATAKRVSHPKAPDAVELSSVTRGEAGEQIRVVYVLRWPSMDLLEKRMSAGGGTMTLTVMDEHCDDKLKLCVPRKLEQRYDGQPGATTTVTKIALNAAPAMDAFTVTVPEGFSVEKRPLDAAGR